jgi:transposase
MELYAGLDLHSRNTYIGIMDKAFSRVFKKRVPNHLEQILQTLAPFRDQIKGFVVESTYNWYWLVDGLMDAGYSSAHLAKIDALLESAIKDDYSIIYWIFRKKTFFKCRMA